MKKLFYSVILFSLLFITSGCFDWNNLDNATIYTTVYPIEYLVENLYSNYKSSSSIYPTGADVANYSLTDKQVLDFSKGTLFVYNGITNEKQIAKSFINKNKQMKIIDVAQGLKYTYGVEELWLSPSNYLMLATNFKNNLEKLVGSKYTNDEIETKYHDLEETLSIMDAEIRKIATTAKESNRNTLVVTKKIFKFLENYGFNIICLEDYEENSANLNTLKNNFRNGTYKYLFKRNDEDNSGIIEDLKKNYNATVLDINMMNTLTNEDSTYLTIMNELVTDLKNATNS